MLQSKIHIGRLDREITFIQPIIEDGDSNEDKITGWEEIDSFPTVSAAKKELTGTVYTQADRLTYTQQTEWIIRYRDDINVRMRIVYSTKVYEIINIIEPDESRSRYLKIVSNLLDNVFFSADASESTVLMEDSGSVLMESSGNVLTE
jgi:SPP1 family predicted phage head-tail adaptor